ncbi:arf-GAP with Rho-GAP domain, ANK repeat and PH domain-containing protein 1 isoform X1 [Alosa alosa]|uniref:arf-GAP with Rho-GAP domain, ANK repeat and PH domain-containing protein 1 isoform X1 n=1 Tax=Alosa alosa TaxID=278164 RepID=UPI0020150665|nr:arf-GAP with Rho-GAP domain, ANK repeat and PH domain-containing protein 1 isoform X1 [Alosa alosa]
MSSNINQATFPPVPKPRARYKLKVGLQRQSAYLDSDSVWYDSEAPSTQVVSNEENAEPLTVPSTDVPGELHIGQSQQQLQENLDQSSVATPTSPTCPTSTDVPGELPIGQSQQQLQENLDQSSVATPTSPTCPTLPTCPPSPPLSPVGAAETEPTAAVSDSSNDEEAEVPMTPDSLKSDEEVISGDAGEIDASLEPTYISVVPNGQGSIFNFGMTTEPTLKEAEKTIEAQLQKQKTPRMATIRVSRKKQGRAGLAKDTQPAESRHKGTVVSRSSWLDVWKGRKHNVLWATLDGQLMSLWKKRTDKFTEYVFHVSSITAVSIQGKGRFSIYFGKKHFEFMAHDEAVQEGWVSSLHATRGIVPLPPPDHQSSLIMKDPRTKVYAAICGHNLWIYNKKEDFNLGIGMTCVSMNVASVKQTGKRGFSLISPYKTFNFSTDSSRELTTWLNCLNQGIISALSCSEVAQRLWASPWNKVCADCGSASPEWASINLLLVICEDCAGQHRALGANKSKVRSLKLDSKVWTESLIELFVAYGNKAANDVWGYNIPAAEQILPNATSSEREAFIKAKYIRGLYRRSHPLTSNRDLLDQRLCQVVCGPDVSETLSLICSGARVLCKTVDGPIALAEQAGQALQVELLRHNEFLEVPNYDHQVPSKDNSGLEELHGKLQDERLLFSQENDSAACDVLDLREVIAVYDRSEGSTYEFDMLTLTDKLVCNANTLDSLLSHLLHILKVVLPCTVEDAEVTGIFAASRVSVREGDGLQHTEAWVALRDGEALFFPTDPQKPKERLTLSTVQRYDHNSTEHTIEMALGERTVSLRFEKQSSCTSWYTLLQRAVLSPARESQSQPSLTQLHTVYDTVPPAVERCIFHINTHGLKVEGLYRRCGVATKTSHLVQTLSSSASAAVLETDEQGILDTCSALKQLLRRQPDLIPQNKKPQWVKAAAGPHEALRLQSYCRLMRQLPLESRAMLEALCGHLYLVQVHSQENRMTAQNLALVFVPTLFQELAMSTDMVRLTRELIIHHTLIFQKSIEMSEEEAGTDQVDGEQEEIITVF